MALASPSKEPPAFVMVVVVPFTVSVKDVAELMLWVVGSVTTGDPAPLMAVEYAPGESTPPLDQVAQRIQEILLEQQVNKLFDNWLNNLRQQGDVEVLDPALASTAETPEAPSGPGRGSL